MEFDKNSDLKLDDNELKDVVAHHPRLAGRVQLLPARHRRRQGRGDEAAGRI